MSYGDLSRISVKSRLICSDSMLCPEVSFTLVLSMDYVRVFFKTKGSFEQMLMPDAADWKGLNLMYSFI